ncbi:hypothetical protein [Mycobacterium intracellulare]|uniref:hypothetical protein n=1 Tax=Mycobacterium intracellulare TaxID=1767 RepID=UPI001FF9DF8B|nr:hypothetical protein [Mycobacterium intracellulare]
MQIEVLQVVLEQQFDVAILDLLANGHVGEIDQGAIELQDGANEDVLNIQACTPAPVGGSLPLSGDSGAEGQIRHITRVAGWGTDSAFERAKAHFAEFGSRNILRLNPFHAGCANERQPARDGDLGDIAQTSLRDELIDQALAHDVELFGDDRLDRWVIRQCPAAHRHCFKGMIAKILDVGLESAGQLFRER